MGAQRSIALVVGLSLGVVVLYYANRSFDSIWIPFAFITAIFLQLRSSCYLAKHGLVSPLAITFTIGVMIGWFSTSGIPPKRMDFMFWPCLVLFLPFAGALRHTFLVTARVSMTSRRAAWWTWMSLFMAGIISVASSSVAGADGMVVWTKTVLHLEPSTAETVVHYIRKTIHFSYYGLVGLTAAIATLFGGLNNGELDPSKTKHESVIEAWQRGLLFALTVASFDELRQSTQPGRNGSIFDVVLDMSGAVVFVTFIATFAAFKNRSTTLKAP